MLDRRSYVHNSSGVVKLKPEKSLGLNFFQALISQLLKFYRYSRNSQSDQLPDGFDSSVAKHCTGIAEVMGSNPVQDWFFFQVLTSQLLKLCK